MADDAKAVVRALIDALNDGNLDGAMPLIAADAVDHSPVPGQAPGPEGWRQKWEMFHAAFPDATFRIEQAVAESDTVASRYTLRATHKGSLMAIPPTGRRIEILTLDMIRVRDGQVVEHWSLLDQTALMMQIGILPQPAAPTGQRTPRGAPSGP